MGLVEKRTEFPALEARKEYLQHEYYTAKQQADDAAYAGKPDNAMLQWLLVIKAELDELRYVLKIMTEPNSRVEISGKAMLLVIVILAGVLLAQIMILINVG